MSAVIMSAIFASLTTSFALTAFARNDDQQEALKAGFQMHLAKPVNPEELIAVIVQLLEAKTG